MKIYIKLLALWVFHPTTAFLAQAPGRQALSPMGWKTAHAPSPTYSYPEYLGSLATSGFAGVDSSKSEVNGEVAGRSTMTNGSPSYDVSYTKKLEARLAALEKQGGEGSTDAKTSDGSANQAKKFRDNSSPIIVQGGSLKTWSFASASIERVQLRLQTEGRPLDADIELWQGPDNTPHKIRVYVEDGKVRPFNCVMLTPRGPNTIAIRNTGQMEFPMAAFVSADDEKVDPFDLEQSVSTSPRTIQGGALRTYPFEPTVESVQVLLKTDGRPLNARIELLQGPNNNKQVIEVYTEDGNDRPFFIVIETPGSGNVVRVVNTATVEFPMTALVEPYLVVGDKYSAEAVLGGDSRANSMPFGRD